MKKNAFYTILLSTVVLFSAISNMQADKGKSEIKKLGKDTTSKTIKATSDNIENGNYWLNCPYDANTNPSTGKCKKHTNATSNRAVTSCTDQNGNPKSDYAANAVYYDVSDQDCTKPIHGYVTCEAISSSCSM